METSDSGQSSKERAKARSPKVPADFYEHGSAGPELVLSLMHMSLSIAAIPFSPPSRALHGARGHVSPWEGWRVVPRICKAGSRPGCRLARKLGPAGLHPAALHGLRLDAWIRSRLPGSVPHGEMSVATTLAPDRFTASAIAIAPHPTPTSAMLKPSPCLYAGRRIPGQAPREARSRGGGSGPGSLP